MLWIHAANKAGKCYRACVNHGISSQFHNKYVRGARWKQPNGSWPGDTRRRRTRARGAKNPRCVAFKAKLGGGGEEAAAEESRKETAVSGGKAPGRLFIVGRTCPNCCDCLDSDSVFVLVESRSPTRGALCCLSYHPRPGRVVNRFCDNTTSGVSVLAKYVLPFLYVPFWMSLGGMEAMVAVWVPLSSDAVSRGQTMWQCPCSYSSCIQSPVWVLPRRRLWCVL